MARISAQEAGGEKVLAFLDAIKMSELGAAIIAGSDEGYNVLVGSTAENILTFDSYADHPNRLMTLTIHHKDGTSSEIKSTAAGAGQIIHPTWLDLNTRTKYSDFGPVNQDRAMIQLIREAKALPRVIVGDVRNAMYMCNKIWASLAGAGYNQHENPVEKFSDWYYDALGNYV